ncbi:MAG: hypothetical protein V1701_05755 [Planctomycetota bacterium]
MKTLRRTLALVLGLGLLGWITAGFAEEQKPAEKETPKSEIRHTIELKYAQGEKIGVDKNTGENLNIKGKIRMLIDTGAEEAQSQNMDLEMDGSESSTTKYEEEILEVSVKGEVNKVKREYFKDECKKKSKTTMEMMGQEQAPQETQSNEASQLSGKTIILERDGKEIKVKIKDSKEKLKEAIEKSLEIDDPVKFILPKEPVKTGDKWQIDPDEGWKLFAMGTTDTEIMKQMKFVDFVSECTLKEVSQNGQAESARIAIKGTMKCEVDDLKAVLGDKGDEDKVNPLKGMVGSMTLTIKFSGELLFDITNGRPLSLEINQDDVKGFVEGEGAMKQQGISIDLEMRMKCKGDAKSVTTYKYAKEK